MVEKIEEERRIISEIIRMGEERKAMHPAFLKFRKLLKESREKIKTIKEKREFLKKIEDEIKRLEYFIEKLKLESRGWWRKFLESGGKVFRFRVVSGKPEYFENAVKCWRRIGWYTAELNYCWRLLKRYWLDELVRELGYEFIDIDSRTGRDIFFDRTTNTFFQVDEEGREVRSKDVEITLTFSIETDGHEYLYCEITTRTKVSAVYIEEGRRIVLDKSGYEHLKRVIEKKVNEFFHNMRGFDQVKSRVSLKKISVMGVEKEGVEVSMFPRTDVGYPLMETVIEKMYEREKRYPERQWKYGKISAFLVDSRSPKKSAEKPETIYVDTSIEKPEEYVEEMKEKKRRELGEVL